MKLKWSVWGCGVCMASMALVAFGVSCSGPEEEEEEEWSGSAEYEETMGGPSRAESAAFLQALQAMKLPRPETGEPASLLFFDGTNLKAAWEAARWEVPMLKKLPAFDGPSIDIEPLALETGSAQSAVAVVVVAASPHEALLAALQSVAEFHHGCRIFKSLLDEGESIKMTVRCKLGPFDYESEIDIVEAADSSHLTTRYRYSRSGKAYAWLDIHATATGAEDHFEFVPNPRGLELTDIVRGLIKHRTSRFSLIFLSGRAGEGHAVCVIFTPKKK